jgi:hypothetical protein
VYQKQVFRADCEWVKTPGPRGGLRGARPQPRAAYGTHGLLLDGGQTVATGEIGVVFAPEYINKAYGMDVPAWMRRMLAQWQEEEYHESRPTQTDDSRVRRRRGGARPKRAGTTLQSPSAALVCSNAR